MKLKILTLLLCFSFNFLHSSFAAVAVKKKENTTVLESSSKKTPSVKSHKKWKWFQKKRKLKKRKFRLFDFSKWKKKKRIKRPITEVKDNRKVDTFALISFVLTIVGTLLFLFAPIDFYMILKFSFILIGGFLGIIGLGNIRRKPEKKKGETLALIGIMGLVILGLMILLIRLLDSFDF